MSRYEFVTDAKGEAYCDEIVESMMSAFRIGEEEAIGRINRAWRTTTLMGEDYVYHETPRHWAYSIYFGPNSNWWIDCTTLKPVPYP